MLVLSHWFNCRGLIQNRLVLVIIKKLHRLSLSCSFPLFGLHLVSRLDILITSILLPAALFVLKVDFEAIKQ